MRSFFILMVLLLPLIVSCEPSNRQKSVNNWMSENGKLKVLSTTAMISDLVSHVGGDYVDSLSLISEELDPHSYQLVKGDDEKFARANVIFYNGLNLEHGPSLQNTLKNSPKAVALGDSIQKSKPDRILHYGNQFDPHIWMDIELWSNTLPYIVEALSKADPKHAAEYAQSAEKYKKEMLQIHQKVRSMLHSIPPNKRYLVTSHDAFNYFTRAYLAEDSELENGGWQVRFAAPEGLAPDSQLSSADIQAIIDHLDRYDIMVIFPESNVSRDSIRKIVDAGKQKGLILSIAAEALYGDAMGPKGSDGDTYLKMIEHNAKTFLKYLNGNGKEERQAALIRI